jgi:parallel beta-helix repeat protein
VWTTSIGGGGVHGGIEWGTATDGKRIYIPDTNVFHLPVTITSATGQKSTITSGYWTALDPSTGAILWQTATPNHASPLSFVSASNGLVYSGSTDATGPDMFALDAATGAITWSFASGGAVLSGPAIVDGSLYWGSGYHTQELGPFFPGDGNNNKVFAFSLPATAAAPTTVFVSPTGTAGASDTSCTSAAFKSANAAIGAVADGGRVVMCGGTYQQSVNVTKSVTLDVSGNVVIDATNQLNGVHVTAPNVTVHGLTVKNAIGEGILVDNVNGATINNDIVENNDLGSGSAPAANEYGQCSLNGDCGGGIHLLSSSNSSVIGNTSDDNSDGILISDETGPAAHNVVQGNSTLNNATGSGIALVSRSSSASSGGVPAPNAGGVFSNTVDRNTTENNGLTSGGAGILLASSATGGAVYDNTLTSNIVSGNAFAGITIHGGASNEDLNGNALRTNTVGVDNVNGDTTGPVSDTGTTGVLVTTVDALSVELTGNQISSNQFGLWTHGPVTATGAATNNTFTGVAVPVSAH